MTAANPFERLVEDWLASAAPVAIPHEIHGAVVDAARRTRQSRRGIGLPTRPDMLRTARLAVDLAAVLVLVVAAQGLLSGPGPTGPGVPAGSSGRLTPSPSIAATGDVRPTPEVDPHSAAYSLGRHALTVDGFPFSFEVHQGTWEPYGGFLIGRSVFGPQGAEGIIFWAGFPDGVKADPCEPLSEGVGLSPELVADAVAEAPGVEVVNPPSNVMLGGRQAAHVVVSIREDLGCDPGYFYNWKAQTGGALWVRSGVGDTYKVWIVDIGGRLLFIGSATHPGAGPHLGPQMDEIVNSIVFE